LSDAGIKVPDAVRSSFTGDLLSPGDDGYEDARRIHNGMIDKRPALIARCRTTEDVVAAVNIGREAGVEISIRGGGHNVAGKAVTDGGLMIDLALMTAVEVDPEARTITAEGGTTWGQFNNATYPHGLATTGGTVSTTGIAGLTLGGGVGWLMGRYGLACDNLLAVEVVTATGEVVVASEDEHPDLFWGLKGGGGNFGVATRFTYRAHPVKDVTGGVLAYPVDQARAVFDLFRRATKNASDDLGMGAGFLAAPDGSGAKMVAFPICHAGDPAAAEAELAPLRTGDVKPALELIGEVPYPIVNTLLDVSFPKGAWNYWKSAFFTDLSDAAIEVMIDAYAKAPSDMSLLTVEHVHGAAARIDPAATAFPHRQEGYNSLILAQWADPADTDANVAWARETFEALRPYMAERRYVNYLSADDGGFVRQAYGENWQRLVELKRTWDPHNLFRLNQNISPA
jgi:FAD/FMN-containing dehydrogenase